MYGFVIGTFFLALMGVFIGIFRTTELIRVYKLVDELRDALIEKRKATIVKHQYAFSVNQAKWVAMGVVTNYALYEILYDEENHTAVLHTSGKDPLLHQYYSHHVVPNFNRYKLFVETHDRKEVLELIAKLTKERMEDEEEESDEPTHVPDKIEILRKNLEDAIQKEDYEEADRLAKKIQELEKKRDGQENE